MIRQATVAVIVFLVLGCQWSENRYAKREMSAAEVIGTWQLTDFGLASLRDVGVKEHLAKDDWQLTFRKDGSCSARLGMNVPPSARGIDYRQFEAGCTWRIGHFDHEQLSISVPVDTFQPYFFFDEENGKLLLWQYATDPDAWKYVEFAKIAGT